MDKIHTGAVKQKHLIKQRNSLTIQEKKTQKHTHVKYQMALWAGNVSHCLHTNL